MEIKVLERGIRLMNLYVKSYIIKMDLQHNIISLIDKIPLKKWWGQMLLASADNKEKVLKLSFPCDISDIKISEEIRRIEEKYHGFKANDQEFFDFYKKELEILKNDILPPNSTLNRFLSGKRVNHYDIDDLFLFLCFRFRILIKLMFYYSESSKTLKVEEAQRLHTKHMELHKKYMSSLSSDELDFLIESNYLYQRFSDTNLAYDLVADKVLENMDVFRGWYEKDVEASKALLSELFLFLNTCLIDKDTADEIVKLLSETLDPIKLQKKYDSFLIEFSKKKPNIIKEIDFAKDHLSTMLENVEWKDLSKRDKSCFNCGMTKKMIIQLYKTLISQKYIDSKTDILDFTHFLTGLPIKDKKKFGHINWVQEEKQGLAIFIALIKEHDKKKTTWKEASKLFRFNGKEVSLKSTQFSQAKGNKKYDSLISIINVIFAK